MRSIHIAFFLVLALACQVAIACPYCSQLGSTLTLDVENFAVVVVGVRQEDDSFKIARTLKGEELLSPDSDRIVVPESVPGVPSLAFGAIAGDSVEWPKVQRVSQSELRYLIGALRAIAEDPIDLSYFYPNLGHPNNTIGDDAFYQFARTDYSVLVNAKEHFEREQLMRLLDSPHVMPELRELALQLLGMVGTESDAHLALTAMQADDAGSQRNLKTIMASYISLAGEPGLELIEKDYLANSESKYEFTHAAIEAIRFHLSEVKELDRQRLLTALHAVLTNTEISDIVLPDLIAANDWTAISKVAELFRNAPSDQRWVRVAAAKYLLAAPEAASKTTVAELRAVDASAFAEAETGKPTVPTNTARDSGQVSRSVVDLINAFLSSPGFATATIAIVIALLAVVALRFFSKKKP